MTFRNRLLLLCSWTVANAIGIGAYLSFASELWTRPGEEGGHGSPNNAFYWMSHSVPVLVLFLATNFSAVIALRRSKDKLAAVMATITFRVLGVVWVLVLLLDWYWSQ